MSQETYPAGPAHSAHLEAPKLSASARATLVPLAGLAALVVYFGIAADNFLTIDNLYSILRDGAVLLIVGIGMTWVIMMGSIDLSVGAILTMSGLLTALMLQHEHGIVLAIAVGLGAGLAAGAVNGVLFAYAKVPSFLVTLGTSLVITGVAQWAVDGRSVQVLSLGFTNIASESLLGDLSNVALWSLVIYALAVLVGLRTRFGRFAYAIGGGEAVARLSGVPVRRFKFYVFVVSGLLAALAGILLTSRIGAADPAMGNTTAIDAIAAVVMGGTALTGGVGGVHRTLLGVLVITTLENGLDTMAVNTYLQSIIHGAVVILAVGLTLDRSKISILK